MNFWTMGIERKDLKAYLDKAQAESLKKPETSRLCPLNKDLSHVKSALGPGTVIQGKLQFDSAVRIDGKLGGELRSTEVLVIGPTGIVDAEIEVASLIVMGVVRGKITASDRIELLAGGVIEGEVTTPCMLMELGSRFTGQSKMPEEKIKSAKTKPQTVIFVDQDLDQALEEPKPAEQLGSPAQ